MKKKKPRDRPPKRELGLQEKIKLIVLVSFLIGGAILVSDYLNNRVQFDGVLTRKEAGKGDSTENVEVFFNDNHETKTIEIEEQALDENQLEEIFDEVIREIDKTYLGKNKSPDKVQYDLVLKSKYADGLVKAAWQVDDYSNTYSHTDLTKLDKLKIAKELKYSKKAVEELAMDYCHALAYPMGKYNEAAIEVAEATHYVIAFGTFTKGDFGQDTRYSIPRIEVGSRMSAESLGEAIKAYPSL